MVLKSVIKFCILITIILGGSLLGAEAQIKSSAFDPSLVPVNFELVNTIDNDLIISLPTGKSGWLINRRGVNGEQKWSQNLDLEENENIFSFRILNNSLVYFSTKFNASSAKTELYHTIIDPISGKVIERKLLWSNDVGNIKYGRNKAKRIADATLELSSLKSASAEVPLQYRYEIKNSKGGNFTIVSFFDFSKDNLIHNYKIYNSNFEELEFKSLKLDELVYLYDYGIDESGSVYHLNQSFSGDIQLLRFPIKSDEYDLLMLTAENSQRDDLKMLELQDGRIVVAGKGEIEDSFYGCIYAVFDFNLLEVDRVHFEKLPENFKNSADSLYQIGKMEVRDWRNYTLTELSSFNDEELLIVFESFDLRRSGYVFKDLRFSTELEWSNHKAKLISGPAMVFSFDKNDELRWSKYFYKKVEMSEELPSVSTFESLQPKDEQISFLMSMEDGSYEYQMDYIYNSWQKTNKLSEYKLLSQVQVGDNANYLVFFSKAESRLIINKK